MKGSSRMTVAEAVLWIAFGEHEVSDIQERLDPEHVLWLSKSEVTPEQIQAAKADSNAVDQALKELNKQVGESKLTVIGQLMANWEPNPITVHERIEPDYFRSSTICLNGQAYERDDYVSLIANETRRRYSGLLLDSAEVMKVWPQTGQGSSHTAADDDRMLSYMLAQGEAILSKIKAKPKRDDLVKACVAEFKCRYEDAQRVHALLPDHLRRKRGESKK